MISADDLHDVLNESRRLGFLGPAPVEEVVDHAGAYVRALADVTGTIVDLGAGGGVPGLVVAAARPDLRLVMIDRRAKRTDFLDRMVRRLGETDRVQVVAGDVRRHLETDAGRYDAAIARGFADPETTLTWGARLIRPGGRVVISEPPEGDRWDDDVLRAAGVERRESERSVAVFESVPGALDAPRA